MKPLLDLGGSRRTCRGLAASAAALGTSTHFPSTFLAKRMSLVWATSTGGRGGGQQCHLQSSRCPANKHLPLGSHLRL